MSLSRTAKKTLVTLLITIIGGLFVYSAIGILLNVTNTVIYDSTPMRIYHDSTTPDYSLSIQINNNDPLPVPYLNPFYTIAVNVTGDNNAYAYFESLGRQARNFTDWNLDVGKIDSGSSTTQQIMLHIGNGSFSVRVDVYLTFLVQFKARSATYLFEHEGNNYYNVTRAG
jgi:hypothetical protein